VDWDAVRARYADRRELRSVTGTSVVEVVSVDEDRICLRQRLWRDCVSRHQLETALRLLAAGTVGGTAVEVAEGLRRYYAGGPEVQPGCSRTPNLAAVVLQDLGYLAGGR
jgi:hypothetical protein